jgi:hypothetical protein
MSGADVPASARARLAATVSLAALKVGAIAGDKSPDTDDAAGALETGDLPADFTESRRSISTYTLS